MRWALLALLALPSGGSEERFIPPELGDSKVLYCSVGGNPDGTSDAVVGALYVHRGEYRALLSRRSDVLASLEDCSRWNRDVASEISSARSAERRLRK